MENPSSEPRRKSRLSAGLRDFERAKKLKTIFFEFIRKLNRAESFDKTPHRSAFLRAHYNWTALIFGLMFMLSVSSWYGETPMKCIEQYDLRRANEQIEDVCVQFPYTRYNNESQLTARKYYALYYMWIHWLCLFLYFTFKSVLAAVLLLENKQFRSFLRTLNTTVDYNERLQATIGYYQKNFGTHLGMARNRIFLNIYSIIVNCSVFFGLDILLERNYWKIPLLLTVTRDCTHFDDPFSIIFPPFAYCDFYPKLQIQVGRHQLFGCHLALNEVYGKFFVGFWFWQVFLAFWGICSLWYWTYIYCNKSTSRNILDDGCYRKYPSVKLAAASLSTDEAIAMSIIKQFLFGTHYRALMCAISEWEPKKESLTIGHISYHPFHPGILGNHAFLTRNRVDTIDSLLPSIFQQSTMLISDKFSGRRNDDDSKNKNDGSFLKSDDSQRTPDMEECVNELKTLIDNNKKKCHPSDWSVPIDKIGITNKENKFLQDLDDPTILNNIDMRKELEMRSTEELILTSTRKKEIPQRKIKKSHRNPTAKDEIISESTINHGSGMGWKYNVDRNAELFSMGLLEHNQNTENCASTNLWQENGTSPDGRVYDPTGMFKSKKQFGSPHLDILERYVLPTAPVLRATSSSESNGDQLKYQST